MLGTVSGEGMERGCVVDWAHGGAPTAATEQAPPGLHQKCWGGEWGLQPWAAKSGLLL